MQVMKTYCDICKGQIEDEVFNVSLDNESYEICKSCADKLEDKIAEMEKELTDDLPF